MKTQSVSIIVIACVAALLTACQRVQPPEVDLSGVRIAGVGLRGATLIADLGIENPNDFAIEADSITFDLDASNPDQPGTWTPMAQGTNRERVRVEAGSGTQVEIPIELSYSNLSAPLRSLIDRGTFNYRISGAVLVGEPRRKRAPFSKTGRLSLGGNP